MGKLERNKVCVLYAKNVEISSDYKGVLYVSLEEYRKSKLAKELENVGLKLIKISCLKYFEI